MHWIEVSLSVEGEAAAIAEVFRRCGCQRVTSAQAVVYGYLPADEQTAAARARLEAELAQLKFASPNYKEVSEPSAIWKSGYHPVRLGKRLVVWIENLDIQPHDLVIEINSGAAFGRGTHPSTQLCLIALEALIQPGMKVLDLGCGSGILSIAAVKLGAAEVLALDIDAAAVQAARENAVLNQAAQQIEIMQGSLETVLHSARQFDIVLVNILAPVIIAMCDQHLGDVLRADGKGIFSGMQEDEVEDVEAALRKTQLLPYARRRLTQHSEGDWVALEALRV